MAQARAFAGSIYSDPERGSVLKDTAREMISTLMPGKH
jgi:hypothetical protein